MTRACCPRCESFRLVSSRRRGWVEYAVALWGWKMMRCKECGVRYLYSGAGLVRTARLRLLERRILWTIATLAAVAAVVAAILVFTHMQPPGAVEGMWFLL